MAAKQFKHLTSLQQDQHSKRQMSPDRGWHLSLECQSRADESGRDQRPLLEAATEGIGEQAVPFDVTDMQRRYCPFETPARWFGGKQQARDRLVRVERVAVGIGY